MYDFNQHTYTRVESIKWTGDNPYAVRAFVGMHKGDSGDHHIFTLQNGFAELYVASTKTWVPVRIGDRIIRDRFGYNIQSRATRRGLRVLKRKLKV